MKFKFSNFQRMETPLIYGGVTFWTVENFYQAMKSSDIEVWRKVAKMLPKKAKSFCSDSKNVSLPLNWEKIKIQVMEFALRHKFQKGKFRKLLMQSDEKIVEWNIWHDNFWGDCLCPFCTDAVGQNNLGKILMKIRSENNG